jgi:short-subunit dehydrogenase
MKKVVVITGASSGLGKEIARLFIVKKEYYLVLTGRNKNGLDEFRDNPNVSIITGDITRKDTVDEIENVVAGKFKRIDILINNAGIVYINPFEENTQENLQQLIATDLIAPMLLTQRLYPVMVKQQSGHIINVNSTAGLEEKLNHTMYNAAKFGLTGFTKSLRLEARKHNIKVTSFHPGGMNTEFYDDMKDVPKEKYMDPKKIAGILVALAETDSSIAPDEIIVNRMTK